jgi:hypothetical protein
MEQLSAGCVIKIDCVALLRCDEMLHLRNVAYGRSPIPMLCPRVSNWSTGGVSPNESPNEQTPTYWGRR